MNHTSLPGSQRVSQETCGMVKKDSTSITANQRCISSGEEGRPSNL